MEDEDDEKISKRRKRGKKKVVDTTWSPSGKSEEIKSPRISPKKIVIKGLNFSKPGKEKSPVSFFFVTDYIVRLTEKK